MLQLTNGTPFPGTIYLIPDAEGIDSLFPVLKGPLTFGERLSLAEQQVPVALVDAYHGEPGKSTIKLPSDVSLMKPGTDVLLLGSAHAPGGQATTQMEVSLAAGPVRKAIRAFGDPVGEGSGAGHAIARPAPVDTVARGWERALGGA